MAAEPFVVHRPHARSAANQLFHAGWRLRERESRQQQVEAGLTNANLTKEGTAAAMLPRNGLKNLNCRWCALPPQRQLLLRTRNEGRWYTADKLMCIST